MRIKEMENPDENRREEQNQEISKNRSLLFQFFQGSTGMGKSDL